jgi:hypothetical protein
MATRFVGNPADGRAPYDHQPIREVARCEEAIVAVNGRPVCEVCQQPIGPGEMMVIAQESDGVVMVDLLDTTADGRVGAFHETHWDERIGNWQERDRGQAK